MGTKSSAKTPTDVEQHAVIKCCVKLKKPSMETKKMIEEAPGNKSVCLVLVYTRCVINDSARAGIVLTMFIKMVTLCRSKTTLRSKRQRDNRQRSVDNISKT